MFASQMNALMIYSSLLVFVICVSMIVAFVKIYLSVSINALLFHNALHHIYNLSAFLSY